VRLGYALVVAIVANGRDLQVRDGAGRDAAARSM